MAINRKVLNPDKKRIALVVDVHLKLSNIPVEEVARETGLPKVSIYKIIRGRGYSMDTFLTLCNYLKIKIKLS